MFYYLPATLALISSCNIHHTPKVKQKRHIATFRQRFVSKRETNKTSKFLFSIGIYRPSCFLAHIVKVPELN